MAKDSAAKHGNSRTRCSKEGLRPDIDKAVTKMATSRRLGLWSMLLLLSSAAASALKMDMPAGRGERCIRNWAPKDTLVVVTAVVSGHKGDGMIVNMHIKDVFGNDYGRVKDIAGEQRSVFTTHADASFDVCIENLLSGGCTSSLPSFWSLAC